ncbi:M14 family zinc carboxypeptidase [Natrinema salaciae]|uniref:Zinc carboxypeptidase n=1 Tax=Natrinema salaciae TaxID=1186196 RepID=A0A1H9I5L0_9EURY|nr:M14 family zinc carboxypeptidase [Natrinema salaciae]SEQ69818.1 Zinc carboxypeptidase [Natrinema salaciae]
MTNRNGRSKSPRADDRVAATGTADGQDSGDEFADSVIDRRTYLSLSAATGAALALPGSATADVRGEPITDELAFVVNHTPDEYEAATVVEFANRRALEAFADDYVTEPDPELSRAPKAVTRNSPAPAAHARLTADEVADVCERDGVERLDFSPGANPWWKLDSPYEDGVFPPVESARNYVAYEELAAGLDHLESARPDRVRVQRIGESPGWTNRFTGEESDPRPVYVAEVTANVRDEESVAEKERIVYSLSIHGDERAGAESGCRLLEDLATGRADDFEHLLDDIVLVFLFPNPDGWVSRTPQTAIPWVEAHDTNFQRGNASVFDGQPIDTNRQYPTIGWTNPAFRPAEPDGAPEEFEALVPDALAIVDHLRDYDDVALFCDYHGMYTADHAVFNLETNASLDHGETNELDELNVRIGEAMQSHWGGIEAIEDDIATAIEEMYDWVDDGDEAVPDGDSYDGLFDWGTTYDSISYQVTGGFADWAGQPEAFGGLGAVAVTPEVVLSNHQVAAQKEWKPYSSRHYVTAYRISMRTCAELIARETSATVATGGQNVAYVTTDELTRTSAALPHTDDHFDPDTAADTDSGPDGGRGTDHATEVRRNHRRVEAGSAAQSTVAADAVDSSHSLFVHFDGVRNATTGTIRVKDPTGTVVREIDLAAKADPTDLTARRRDVEEVFVRRPRAGRWEIDVDADADIRVGTTVIDADGDVPDPEEVLGYEQRAYSVTPLQFFDDLEPFLEDGEIEGMSILDVAIGRLLWDDATACRYDKLVVSHDVGLDHPLYLRAIERFVELGGDLVLTDAGVNLLGELDVGAAASIAPDDITDADMVFATLEDRDLEHPLLAGIRPRQQEIWKGSQLGYTTGIDQPSTTVERDAFEAAGGSVAGTLPRWLIDDGEPVPAGYGVGAGILPAGDAEITVLGSVLPPARQTELHPFGLADYALSEMGHTLLCNALDFEQRRYVDGDLVRTVGERR